MRRCGTHRLEVERTPHVPCVTCKKCGRLGAIQDEVDVRALECRPARGERVINGRNITNAHVAGQDIVERYGETVDWELAWEREGDNLSGCVHTRIGASGARNRNALAEDDGERIL